jgi:hypothetical protein
MFDPEKLRHVPFFEEIASLEENSDAWNSATAGLVTLRLVDSWLESGTGNASDDEWNFRSVCAAVDKVSERSPMRALLTSVLSAMRSGKPNIRALLPALTAYGKALEWETKFALGSDVYITLLSHLHPIEDAEACVSAYLRLGYCRRLMTELDLAQTAYSSAFDLADAAGDIEGALRARIGDAEVKMLRGNLPSAASQFDDVIAAAPADRFRDVRARALMARASVAALTDQYELSIRLGYESLQLQENPIDRDRILANIAAGFLHLGVYSAARDAYLVLTVTAQEQYVRWTSTLNLLELSVRTGSEVHFEQYNRQLAGQKMPGQLEAAYHLTLGVGLHQFGNQGGARQHLQRALDQSRELGLGQYVMEAEAALTRLEQPAPKRQTPAVATAEVKGVANAIKELRELTRVG